MITRTSMKLSQLIYDNLDSTTKARFYSRGFDIIELQKRLKVLFIYIFLIPILLAASYTTNSYYQIGLSVISLILIRSWNKGHHFKPDICLVITSGVLLGSPLIAHLLEGHTLIPWIIALLMNLFLAPYDKNEKAFMKKSVSVIACFAAYFVNDIITVSFFVLSFDLIKWEKAGEKNGT